MRKDVNCLMPQVKKGEKYNITFIIITFLKENEFEILKNQYMIIMIIFDIKIKGLWF